ncbi:UDP-N-acetylglucosamine 1-carboxyvinyltransferase [Anaerotruncus rubiinfantis]|jgi:UDP-N-acetylglucosamine 1-carboxyvinyltransferase|uniref:UDP-N-acetylglucosamine 1-carboxyvinyltransferase n=1 Tax=Anaerotruncus rubiinfantis TaxID=1720200 RepID=UPI00082F826C|nr:UDP-N-acetylglucosamine 1-carboxyvinyltransferase [Anaerotruncus rubiinfantis]
MEKLLIEGEKRLEGTLRVHGAKNSALPILAATLLPGDCVIHNCPRLTDVTAACNILGDLGCDTHREGDSVVVGPCRDCSCCIPDELMRMMRSSIVFLGAIIAKCGKARISLPGGCELGPRPIDLHLAALERLGVTIREDHGYLDCRVENKLRGAKISLPFPSVGATENIMIAASLAEGETIVKNAAREPEISDLASFLNACGARIHIARGGDVHIMGVQKLHPAHHRVISDRIAAATYLSCAAVTGGDVTLTDVCSEHLSAILPCFEEMGCDLTVRPDTIRICAKHPLRALGSVRTMPYPGFPTDAQPPLVALAGVAEGTSVFIENIFENRYKYVPELQRMGAEIKVEGRIAVVRGVRELHSATVYCTDLRGGAALAVAALAAQGESTLYQIEHIDRGYEQFEQNLSNIGASIRRES